MVFSSVPLWLDAVAYAYIVSAIACSLVIVYDVLVRGHRQTMSIMEYVWPITSLYLNLFGLWAYWKMGRPDSMRHSQMSMENMQGMEMKPMEAGQMHRMQKRFWESVFVSATHCGAGCEIGDFVGEWLVFLLISGVVVAGSLLLTEYAVDFVFAYTFGILFQYIPIRQAKTEMPRVEAWKDAIKAESLSIIAFEVGLFGWMAFFNLALFGSNVINPSMPVYWFMMQIGMLLGHFTSYPANWFLVKWGIKAGM
ncbi:MAG: DUF4396 domain-containing protein [Thaumarchaeota archaeon]|nr:DUF4396 domain-containing protein [Nitrososphaerota archaeon]